MKTVLIIMGRYLPGYKDGGPVQSIKNVTDKLGKEYDFRILTADRDHGDEESYRGIAHDSWNQVGNAKVWYVEPGGFSSKIILKLSKQAELVYVCGCFNGYARTVLSLKKRREIDVPVIIAPMGLFSPGAFHINYTKKIAYILLCKTLGWFRNVGWSVTGKQEEQEVYRIIGKGAKCFQAKDIPRLMKLKPAPIMKEKGELRIIFLSRISPKKNLDYALDIVRQLQGNIIFDIYGVLENRTYYECCLKKIQNMPSNIQCVYRGEVSSESVPETFSGYHVFLFPTKGENYGHVIYEAMAGGCIPVISDRNPWSELEQKEVGRVIPLEQEQEFVKALQKLTDMEQMQYERIRNGTIEYAWEYQNNVDCDGYRRIFELSE